MSDANQIEAIASTLRSTDPLARGEAIAALRRIQNRGQPEARRRIVELIANHLGDADPLVRDEAFLALLAISLGDDPDMRRRVVGTVERVQLLTVGRPRLSSGVQERLLMGHPPATADAEHLHPAPREAAPEPRPEAVRAPEETGLPAGDPKEHLLVQMLAGRMRQFFNLDAGRDLDRAWRAGGGLAASEFIAACRAMGIPALFSLSQMLSASTPEPRQFAFRTLVEIGEPALPFAIESLSEPDRGLRQSAYRLLFETLTRLSRWTPALQKLAYQAATSENPDMRLQAMTRLRDLLVPGVAGDLDGSGEEVA